MKIVQQPLLSITGLKLVQLFFLFVLLFVANLSIYSQIDSITVSERGFLFKKKIYTKCDIELTPDQLVKLIAKDPNMSHLAMPIVLTHGASSILSSIGIALIAWPVIDSFSKDGKPDWKLAYIGAGCVLVSIPFKIAYGRKIKHAVDYYNSGYKQSGSVQFKLNMKSDGIGLTMVF